MRRIERRSSRAGCRQHLAILVVVVVTIAIAVGSKETGRSTAAVPTKQICWGSRRRLISSRGLLRARFGFGLLLHLGDGRATIGQGRIVAVIVRRKQSPAMQCEHTFNRVAEMLGSEAEPRAAETGRERTLRHRYHRSRRQKTRMSSRGSACSQRRPGQSMMPLLPLLPLRTMRMMMRC